MARDAEEMEMKVTGLVDSTESSPRNSTIFLLVKSHMLHGAGIFNYMG